ncbi:hypothetical protein [Actinomadura sp. 6N118]|uniref:hypothetical protein n=1 Tax=Actinomadura sp. 6N118 TaxID=3375151 RepID=UPI0037AE24C1
MTRKQARIGLVISLLAWITASQQAAQRPIDFYNDPVTAFFLYFGPLIALVFLVLSFVGRKDARASAIDANHRILSDALRRGDTPAVAHAERNLGFLYTEIGALPVAVGHTVRSVAMHNEFGADTEADLDWLNHQRQLMGEPAFSGCVRQHLDPEAADALLTVIDSRPDAGRAPLADANEPHWAALASIEDFGENLRKETPPPSEAEHAELLAKVKPLLHPGDDRGSWSNPDGGFLAEATALLATRPLDQEWDQSATTAAELCRARNEGDEQGAAELRRLGEALGEQGGRWFMVLVAHRASVLDRRVRVRDFEFAWDGICGWEH